MIQSTDFSHYLTPAEARVKDAETLAFIALGNPDAVVDLDQPDHIDSKAAQWIQMTLQQRRGASVTVVNNRNSAQYATDGEVPRETTSYVPQVWRRESVPASALPGEAWYFGGDFHLGRGLAEIADDPLAMAWLEEHMRSLTGGRPLILNLEGVLVDAAPDPATLHPMQIVMPTKPTLDLLKRWNVAGVVVANNHTLDLGPEVLISMTKRLREEGFTVLGEGEVAAFPGFDLFAASDVRNRPDPAQQVLRAADFPVLSGSTSAFPHRPRLAFLHWGAEYREGPDQRQRWLAGAAAKAGFDLLMGCHAHVPSKAIQRVEGIFTLPTLGNLLFDQSQRERGGVLLEVRFFEQGTYATRVIPVGNLYREWRGR